jgi:tetratricopeptide (TPR) repeat protein
MRRLQKNDECNWRSNQHLWIARQCVALAIILLSSCTFRAHAQNPASAFEAANRLYDQGKYAEAASAFENLLHSTPATSSLYFDLGNSFFKAGQIGRAIAAYHEAERLSPRDPDLRANLRFARNQIHGPTLATSSWQRWLGQLTLNEWTLLASAVTWLLFLLLAFLQWRPQLRRTLRGYLVFLGIAAVSSYVCLAAAFSQECFSTTAIVISRETPARSSPFEGSPIAFSLQDGAEVRVIDKHSDQKQEWLQVTTDPRRIGWVRRDQVLVAGTHG